MSEETTKAAQPMSGNSMGNKMGNSPGNSSNPPLVKKTEYPASPEKEAGKFGTSYDGQESRHDSKPDVKADPSRDSKSDIKSGSDDHLGKKH
jgi:hypothetical protein